MHPIQLWQVKEKQMIDGVLEPLTHRHLNDFKILWLPQLKATVEEDAHWDWVKKHRFYETYPNYEKYAIACAQATQGMMLLETAEHYSCIDPDQRLVYVDYLATAPWNRPNLQHSPTYRLVGSTLLEFARYRSEQIGYRGYVGLHALPRAQAFYTRMGMLDYGKDPRKQFLHYFEWAPG